MKRTIVILLLGVLVGTSSGQEMFRNNWLKDLFDSMDQLKMNLQVNAQRLAQEIQENVKSHLAEIDRRNNSSGTSRNNETSGDRIMVHDNSISSILVNNVGGTSRTVVSGQSSNGEPYFCDTEDRIDGKVLHRTERIYNPVTHKIEEHKYTLDLTDPKSKPVPV